MTDLRKERQSNIELLRLVAIFMVLIVHADFLALDVPTKDIVHNAPIASFTRFLFQSLSIVCVNVFVLISGWFGIHSTKNGFLKFIFQCIFFYVGIYIIMLLSGAIKFSLNGVADSLLFTDTGWFVKSYILLYILAPVLNAFIENSNANEIRRVLIFFFLFQSLFGFFSDGAAFFENGYSTISFIGLYLLARYLRKSQLKFLSYPPHLYVMVYSSISLLMALTATVSTYITGFQFQRLFTYTNPLVIFNSLCLLLCFLKFRFYSKEVNWLAASAFSIYIFHTNTNIFLPYFVYNVKHIYNTFHGIHFLLILLLFLLFVSIIAILLDKIRICMWNIISKNLKKI